LTEERRHFESALHVFPVNGADFSFISSDKNAS